MKKRDFLKTSSVLVAGTFVIPIASCSDSSQQTAVENSPVPRMNWAGNLEYSASNFYEPRTIEELQELVRKCDKVRILGTRHCFNSIADSKYNQISIDHLENRISINEHAMTVTVAGGVKYGDLSTYLYSQGFALHNLASLPHISIAGACATATHGSGMLNGNLSTAVAAIEYVDASGELVSISRKSDESSFPGAVVHLGGLGALTTITLDIQPAFDIRQKVFQFLPVSELTQYFDDIMGMGYSVSLFTDFKTDKVNQVWVKSKIDSTDYPQGEDFFGAKPATRNIHPIVELSAENCTDQMDTPGPWYDRLPHFKMDFTPSSGKELQSEYFVPLENAVDAYLAVAGLKDIISPLLLISEIRTIAADDLWMSPCYNQPSVTIHFTWKQNWDKLRHVLPLIENELKSFSVRPHWGKLFTMEPTRIHSLYSKLDDFKSLLRESDPGGKFRNEFLQLYLYS